MGQYPLIGVSRWVICINRGCGKGEYGWMLIAVAISKSSREVLLLAMSITATEFQRVLDIIKVWRNEGFEALKIDGQYALCDRGPVMSARDWSKEAGRETKCGLLATFARSATGVP